MRVSELIEKLDLNVVVLGQDKEISGGYTGDLLSLAMSHVEADNIWITVQTNINIVAVACLTDAACIILPEGLMPDENTKIKAESEKIYILSSDKMAFELCVAAGNIIS